MKKIIIAIGVVAVIIGSAVGVAGLTRVRAAESVQGEALTVSPLIIEKQANAGDTITIEVKIRNDLKKPLFYKNYINDFESSDKADEQGVPLLKLDNSKEPGEHSIRRFIQPVADFSLAGQTSRTITFKAVIPAGTTAGGYYGSIRFTAQPSDTSDQVDILASVGNLTFIQIGGANAKEDMKITEFFTSDTSYNKRWFFENGPIQLNEWVVNNGNTFLRPVGHIEVYNIFNQKVAEFKVNDVSKEGKNPHYVLPDSQRKFSQTWNTFWLFGPYTAKLYMIYGNASSTTLDRAITFWVIPWKLILLIIVISIVLVWAVRQGHKRYKKNIIDKDRKKRE